MKCFCVVNLWLRERELKGEKLPGSAGPYPGDLRPGDIISAGSSPARSLPREVPLVPAAVGSVLGAKPTLFLPSPCPRWKAVQVRGQCLRGL